MNEHRLPEFELPAALRPLWQRIVLRAGVGAVWIVGGTVVLVAVAILGVIWYSRQPAGGRLSIALANRALGQVSNLTLSADRSLLLEHGARVLRPVVSVVDSSGRAHRLLVARDVTVRTSWWSLLRGSPDAFDIELREPTLFLVRGPDGRLVLPAFRRSERKPSPLARTAIHLRIRGGRVLELEPGGPADTLARGVALAARATQAGPRWDIHLESAAAMLPAARLAITRAAGEARYEEAHLDVFRLAVQSDAGWVDARVSGAVVPRIDLEGTLEAGEWSWSRIADLTRTPGLDVPGGIAGGGSFRVQGDTVLVRSSAFDVLWRDEGLHASMAGSFASGRLDLSDSRLDWGGTSFRGRFVLDPGPGRGWRLDGRLAGLDLSRLPRLWPMPPLDPSHLGGDVRLSGDGRGLAGEVRGVAGTWRDLPFDRLAGTWSLRDRVQELDAGARVAGGTLAARGTIGPGGLRLTSRAEGLRAEALPATWWSGLGLAHAPAGRIDELEATLSGPPAGPRLLVSAGVSGAAYDSFRVERARVSYDGSLGARGGGTLEARGEEARLGPARADSAALRATIGPDRIDMPTFRAVRGDSVLAIAGHAERDGAAWDVTLERLSWDVGEALALESQGPVEVRLEPEGRVRIDRLHVRSNAGAFSAAGTWGGRRGETDLTIDLETLDLDAVLGPLLPGGDARGVVSGRARATGVGDDLVYTIDLDASDLRWRRAAVRRVTARGRFARDAWTVENLEVDTGRGRLRFNGEVDWARALDPNGGPEAWNRALTEAPRWQGELVTDSLGVDAVADWLPSVGGWRGTLDATFTLAGRPAAPVVQVRGVLHRPGWGQATLQDFTIDLDYRDEALAVRRFAVPGPDSLGPAVSGVLPLRLGWGVRNEDRLPDRPMELSAYARGLDLGLVPLVLPQIAAAGGSFDLVARVGGTPRKPDLTGAVTLHDGILRPAGREEVLTGVEGRLVLAGDSLAIERLGARQGKEGRFTVRPGGWATLKDLKVEDYALDVDVTAGTAFVSGEYVLVLDGAFHVEDGLDLGGPVPLPDITGTARVREGLFLFNFADPTRAQATQGPLVAPPWTYQVDIEAENNVWYRPTDANIEGRLTDFQVIQSADRFLMLGGVEALRGRYYFLGNAFDLRSGNLFFDAAQPLDPTIDAVLVTEKVLDRSAAEGAPSIRETVTLTITGRATAPNVTLSSSPTALSQAEIVELLTYGQLGAGRRALVAAGSQFLVRQLMREVPEVSQTIGDIELGQRVTEGSQLEGVNSQTFTTVGVTRYFTRDLLVRYSQVVGDVSQTTAVDYQDLTAEYRLNRLLFLSGQVTRRRGVLITSQDQTIYNLDVRARHEY